MRIGPSVVAITLQTDHSTYAVGDSVRIRVLLKNPTSVQYAVLRATPWRIVSMVLRRSFGTTVAPANSPSGHDWLMPVSIPLLPGRVQPLYNVGCIKVILRRRNGESSWERSTLVFGPIGSTNAREVGVEGVDIKLRPREVVLFVGLASNPGIAISRDRLVQKLWGIDYVGDERTVDVHIHRQRARLEKPWKLGYVVSTIKSFGYKFVRA